MTTVAFTLTRRLPFPALHVWEALVDWPGHAAWIPATRVRILEGDGGLGTRFVARTGVGPLGFDDNMTVTEFDAAALTARVEKTGPLLTGDAGFRVRPQAHACELEWFETVEVPRLPRILAPLAAAVGKLLFGFSLQRLELHLRHQQ